MTWVKGESGNLKGKPKGALSQKVKNWQELSNYLLGSGIERYFAYLSKLPEEEFVKEFKDILNYIRPKLAQTNINADIRSKIDTVIIEWEKAQRKK